jgi:hypothetical protein
MLYHTNPWGFQDIYMFFVHTNVTPYLQDFEGKKAIFYEFQT